MIRNKIRGKWKKKSEFMQVGVIQQRIRKGIKKTYMEEIVIKQVSK